MSIRMPAPKEVQPKSFKFNKINLGKIENIIRKYEKIFFDTLFIIPFYIA